MGRILGLDYGRQRVGIAVSDPLAMTAQPVRVLQGLSVEAVIEQICILIKKMDVEKIIMGLPLTLKGEKGNMVREVERFVGKLRQKVSIPIIYWDERLTSVHARRILHQMTEKPDKKKERIDQIASVLLLQNYLEYQKGINGESEIE